MVHVSYIGVSILYTVKAGWHDSLHLGQGIYLSTGSLGITVFNRVVGYWLVCSNLGTQGGVKFPASGVARAASCNPILCFIGPSRIDEG